MAATTLALGTSSYALLESLAEPGGAAQLKVTKSGSSTTIRATGSNQNTIDGLGITTSGLRSVDTLAFGNVTGIGNASNTENNSNINAFANLKDFQASLGGAGDTLSIYGGIEGSRIYLDSVYSVTPDGSDLLSVSGSVTQGSSLQDNLIYAGSGNDTIRIAGSIDNAFVFLGAGNDSFTASSGTNVDIKGDAGNDYIQFKGTSTDVRINSGSGADTVVLSGLAGTSTDLNSSPYEAAGTYGEGQPFIFSTQGQAAIEMGDGNDSLVLGSGSYTNASFSTGIGNDTISISKGSDFNNAYFQLGNQDTIQISGKDKFTSAQGNTFLETTISSNNNGGDSLVFGSTTTFLESGIVLAGGSDSIVFGSNSAITNSYINTGSGGDTLVFGSNTTFADLSINLGGADGAVDRIYFNAISKDLNQVKITGADSNDVLYIGATAYTYDSAKLDFYNGTSYFNNNNNNPSTGLG